MRSAIDTDGVVPATTTSLIQKRYDIHSGMISVVYLMIVLIFVTIGVELADLVFVRLRSACLIHLVFAHRTMCFHHVRMCSIAPGIDVNGKSS